MTDKETQEKAEDIAELNPMDYDDFRMWLAEKQQTMWVDKECEFPARTIRWFTRYSRAQEAPPAGYR